MGHSDSSAFSVLVVVVLVVTTCSSTYSQAPYVDIEGLPQMSYYQPGDINLAFMYGFSEPGVNGELCSNELIDGTYKYAEAARLVRSFNHESRS